MKVFLPPRTEGYYWVYDPEDKVWIILFYNAFVSSWFGLGQGSETTELSYYERVIGPIDPPDIPRVPKARKQTKKKEHTPTSKTG